MIDQERINHWRGELRATRLGQSACGKFCRRCLDTAAHSDGLIAELYMDAAIHTIGWLDGAAADTETRPLAEKIPARAAKMCREATIRQTAEETINA